MTDLKTKATACEFGDKRDSLIRDKMSSDLQMEESKNLLRVPNRTMQKDTDLCRKAEATKQQVQAMAKEQQSVEVHRLRSD